MYAAVLRGHDGTATDQSLCLLMPYRKLAMRDPALKVTRVGNDVLEVSSPVFAHVVHTEDHGHELVSDNWFDLIPGVPVRVRVAAGRNPDSVHFQAVMPMPEQK